MPLLTNQIFELVQYFDTDVIINALVEQDSLKHQQSKDLIINALNNNEFAISTMVIHETGYTLARLGLGTDEIEKHLEFFSSQNVSLVEHEALKRGIRLAGKIGFKNVNDCIHTAIAENINCDLFYTYNKSDFKRIQKHTKLKIRIL